ncbi:MAG TPA: hypothetical protein VFE46_17160 [Pirellulales bacterium]|nr:hypothetical protein [Pirellulales bacterium]
MNAVKSRVHLLWFLGLVFCIIVVFGVIYRFHPAIIAIAAAAMGWLVAECNALRSRMLQWPIFKQYIDWQHVHKDIGDSGSTPNT